MYYLIPFSSARQPFVLKPENAPTPLSTVSVYNFFQFMDVDFGTPKKSADDDDSRNEMSLNRLHTL